MATITIFGWSCSNLAMDKTGVYDERAVEVLDSLSNSIGELTSVSYTLNTIVKEKNSAGEIIEIINEHDVYMRGPNKMHINTNGSRGNKGYWYNGDRFAFYSYTNNEYDTMAAPDNILKVIDAIHTKYNIDFPAADFFYATLTDDVLENFDKLLYWGTNTIGDKKLDVISAYNKSRTIQLWVDSCSKLPVKFVLFGEGESNGERYEATFSNWKLNPQLPDNMFEFKPFVDAKKITLQPRKK